MPVALKAPCGTAPATTMERNTSPTRKRGDRPGGFEKPPSLARRACIRSLRPFSRGRAPRTGSMAIPLFALIVAVLQPLLAEAQTPVKPPVIADADALAARAKAELNVTKPDFVVFKPEIKDGEVIDDRAGHRVPGYREKTDRLAGARNLLGDGRPLDGHRAYTLCFRKRDLPPVGAFWSSASIFETSVPAVPGAGFGVVCPGAPGNSGAPTARVGSPKVATPTSLAAGIDP